MFAYCQNNPVIYKDNTGEFVVSTFLISVGIGALIGLGTGSFFGYLNAKIAGTDPVIGAITGGVSGMLIGGITGGAGVIGTGAAYLFSTASCTIINIASDATGQYLNYAQNVENGLSTGDFKLDTDSLIIAGVSGAISGMMGPAVGAVITDLSPVATGVASSITGTALNGNIGFFESGVRALNSSDRIPSPNDPEYLGWKYINEKQNKQLRYRGSNGLKNLLSDTLFGR